MSKLTFRKAEPEDAFRLVLCEQDARERALRGHPKPQEAFAEALAALPLSIAAEDQEGRVVACGGIAETKEWVSPWLLFSDLAVRHKFTLLKAARRVVKGLVEDTNGGRMVFNYIGKESHEAREFVQRLGFRILPSPAGPFDLFYLPHV